MAEKKLIDVEPAYAQVRTAQADDQIRQARETIKRATAQKKLYAPFVPKKAAAKADASDADAADSKD